MLASKPVDQAKPADNHKDDLLIASGQYMSDEIDIDELVRIQQLHARKLRAVALKLAYPSQPDWFRSFLACFHKS
jgi:hypothetical protein